MQLVLHVLSLGEQASKQAISLDWAGERGAVPDTTDEVVVAFWALTEIAAKKVERMMVENLMVAVGREMD
jgi:hypothetical protein